MNFKFSDLFTMALTCYHFEFESQKEETLLRSFPVHKESRAAPHEQWSLDVVVNKGDDVCFCDSLI